VGDCCDIQLLFENMLGLRVPGQSFAAEGLGLGVRYTCSVAECLHTFGQEPLQLHSNDTWSAPLRGATRLFSTQSILDGQTGLAVEGMLAELARYGTQCQTCHVDKGPATDTIIPSGLDAEKELPDMLRICQYPNSDPVLQAVCSTVTVVHRSVKRTYLLLAVVYANSQHFTCDVRRAARLASDFIHIDPMHFHSDEFFSSRVACPCAWVAQWSFPIGIARSSKLR
jgi:hypothetical protein